MKLLRTLMVMASEQNTFRPQERRKRWAGCCGAFACFSAQKGDRRIVPSPHASVSQPNGPQASGLMNQNSLLLAPPSSPVSFSNSDLPSTNQSPSCSLSLLANSPGGPSSTMFATGPYAHETVLVSPPVFSAFTTEPSTAPLTPPPELAHPTTPSSPDVPFARFVTPAADLRPVGKTNYVSANDFQATYPLYPGSPASSRRSRISRSSVHGLSSSFPEREFPPQWDPSLSPQSGKCSRSDSSNGVMQATNITPKASGDTNFFCPATFARFYLDHDAPFSHTGGRLSVSRDSDVYPTNGNGHQHRPTKSMSKQDMEELEAYRASFGFSADEIISTKHYVEIANVMDDSFTMRQVASGTPKSEGSKEPVSQNVEQKSQRTEPNCVGQKGGPSESHIVAGPMDFYPSKSLDSYEDHTTRSVPENVYRSSTPSNCVQTEKAEDLFSKERGSRK